MADQTEGARALSTGAGDAPPDSVAADMAPPSPSPGVERGTPSQQLQDSGIVPGTQEAGEYETLTDAASEQGVYALVGGYLDDAGVVHSEVHLRSMSGEEEDLLGNKSISILDRLNTIVKQCTKSIGTIVDQGQINQAIDRLPIGSRTHLLICLRRTTHWKRHKNIFEMHVRCPYKTCQEKGVYKVDLAAIETYNMPNPQKREHRLKLTDDGQEIVWRVASTTQEKVLDLVESKDDKATLTYSILVRMVSVGDRDMRLNISDLLTPDHKKLKFSKKAEELYTWIRKLSSNDREEFREQMLGEEPGIDTSLEFTCDHCHDDFEGTLDISQESFWFPSAASSRLKVKSST